MFVTTILSILTDFSLVKYENFAYKILIADPPLSKKW